MADPGTTASAPVARGCTACGASNAPSARFCAACGASLPPLTPAGAAPGSVAALLDNARQHVLLGHWEEAGLAAEAVLTLDSDIAEAHHVAALARIRQGMVNGALSHAERAVELDPANPEYQSTLAEVSREVEAAGPRLSPPALIASAVAVVVLLLILIIALANRGGDSARVATGPQTTPTGPPSPFAQPPGNTPFPQPQRTAGVDLNRPRIPARSAAPAPTGAGATGTSGATGAPGASGPVPVGATAPAGAGNLPPAPVDASALRRFPEPANPAPATPVPVTPNPTSTRGNATPFPTNMQPPVPRGVVAPPPPQPGGGTIFGTSPPAVTRESGATDTTPENPPTPATPPAATSPSRPASAQEQYMQRNYGGAIQSLQRQIQAGQATGSNYQKLGIAYESVGDRGQAIDAYRNAVAAYRAQIASGQDLDLANRGLSNAERALRRLQGR